MIKNNINIVYLWIFLIISHLRKKTDSMGENVYFVEDSFLYLKDRY